MRFTLEHTVGKNIILCTSLRVSIVDVSRNGDYNLDENHFRSCVSIHCDFKFNWRK